VNVMPANMSASSMAAYADQKIEDSAQEDKKMNKARRSTALKDQVEASKAKIREDRKAADEELQAVKDKTDGGFWGSIIGIIIAAIAIAVAIVGAVFTGGATMAAVIGIALAVGGAGAGLSPALGSAQGAKNAEDNEAAAAEAQENADSLDLQAKRLEKEVDDLKDVIQNDQQLLESIYQARRKREADQMSVALKA